MAAIEITLSRKDVRMNARMRLSSTAGIGLFIVVAQMTPANAEERVHPLKPAIRIVEKSMDKISRVPAYEATLTKTELVDRSMVSDTMRIKIRREPFSVYCYFEGDHEGREVIYVEGRNKGNLLAHDTGIAGLVGTLELSPTGTQAMSENRHPITKAGIENFLIVLKRQWDDESKYGEIEVNYYKDAKLGKMKCRVIEAIHPQPRRQFKFHKTRLWIDNDTGIAVRLQQYGFPARKGDQAPIVEDYAYTNLKTDIRISDRDFDSRNPNYNF